MKKYFAFVLIPILLSGCGNFKSVPTISGQSFEIDSEKNENEYWMNPEVLLHDAFKKYDFLSENSAEVQLFERAQQSWNLTDAEIKRNVITKYSLHNETYELQAIKSTTKEEDPSNEEFALVLNGKTLLQKFMCFGAEGPIKSLGSLNGKLAVTYVEGHCTYDGTPQNAHSNIFYDGKTFNEEYHVEGSSFPFLYKEKIGFVAMTEGKEYIYFNGQKVSEEFYSIPTTQCCMSVAPLLKLFENGAFVFRASQGPYYYLVEIDLNKYL